MSISTIKRLCVLLIVLWLPISLYTYSNIWGLGKTEEQFFLTKVLEPPLLEHCIYYFLFGIIPCLILLIVAYNIKNAKISTCILVLSVIYLASLLYLSLDAQSFYKIAQEKFNPETVQSTMLEVDLQQLADLQNNEDNTMIYFGRPSCAHCNKIKPNLDILINNSHSVVYYYNSEQDRDTNYAEMQSVLNNYGVSSVPALVILENGNVQETIFDDDIIDYFLDTSKFQY